MTKALRLDTVSNMKKASVREVQHNLAAVLELVARGQQVAVTKRGHVIAQIVPAGPVRAAVVWPDSAARMKLLRRAGGAGTPPSRLIREMRGERL